MRGRQRSGLAQLRPLARQTLLVEIFDVTERLTDEIDTDHLFPFAHELQRDGPGTVLPMAEPLRLLTGTMLGLVLAVNASSAQ